MEAILTQYEMVYGTSVVSLIAGGLILSYAIVAMALMCFILINKVVVHYQERRQERLIARYEDDILMMIVGELKRNDPRAYRFTVDRLRIAFRGSAITTLKDIMSLLARDLSGVNLRLLYELYQDLRLDQRAIQVLQEGTWYEKVKAVKELAHFEITHATPHLSPLTEDSCVTLRNEAQCALLRLGGASKLDFLATLDQPITAWQQIRIHRVLKRFPRERLPQFYTYLTNPNEHVILFVLKLIRVYDQTQAREAVVNMLFDQRPTIQQEAIRTVALWLDQEVLKLLINMYDDGDRMVRLPVVQAMQQWVYDQNTRIFLESIVETTRDYTLRMATLRSLKVLGGKKAIAPFMVILEGTSQRCVVHQLDDRI